MKESLKIKFRPYLPIIIAAQVGALGLILCCFEAIAGMKFLPLPILLSLLALVGIGYACFQMIYKIRKSDRVTKTVYFDMLTVLLLLVMSLCVLACNVIIIVYYAKINSVVITTDVSTELEAIRTRQICQSNISNTIIVRQYLAAILGFCTLASFFVSFLCHDAEKQNRSKKPTCNN